MYEHKKNGQSPLSVSQKTSDYSNPPLFFVQWGSAALGSEPPGTNLSAWKQEHSRRRRTDATV